MRSILRPVSCNFPEKPRYTLAVRRSVAILMSLLFSLWLITPAFSAPTQELPECCQRAGKHHCSMGKTKTEGPVFSNAGCAQFQWHGASVVPPQSEAAEPLVQVAPTLRRLVEVVAEAQAGLPGAIVDLQSRGPPANSLL